MKNLYNLETIILNYYLDKGYKLEKDQKEDDVKWTFFVEVKSGYKSKELKVIFTANNGVKEIKVFNDTNIKDLYEQVERFFS